MAETKEPERSNAVVRYLKEVRAEMSRVVWPSREQAINLTLIVIGVMIAMGVFLGVIDLLFGELIQLLLTTVG